MPKGIASGSSNQWTGSAYLLDKSLDHCDLNGHIISRHSVEHMQCVSDIWQAGRRGGGAGGAEGGGKARPYGTASRAQARSREQWDVTSGSAGVGGVR